MTRQMKFPLVLLSMGTGGWATCCSSPAMHHAAEPVLRPCLHKAVRGPEIEQR